MFLFVKLTETQRLTKSQYNIIFPKEAEAFIRKGLFIKIITVNDTTNMSRSSHFPMLMLFQTLDLLQTDYSCKGRLLQLDCSQAQFDQVLYCLHVKCLFIFIYEYKAREKITENLRCMSKDTFPSYHAVKVDVSKRKNF